jgi:hypothetical protein
MGGGTHDRHNSAPELAEHPPYQIMLDPSLAITVTEPHIMINVNLGTRQSRLAEHFFKQQVNYMS